MAWLYILKGSKDKYYIGSTTNLSARFEHHKRGHTPSTDKLGHLELVFSRKYDNLSVARKVEGRLKKLKRRDYIEKIIADGYIKMKL